MPARAIGGTITTLTIDGVDYILHTFTSSGVFSVKERLPHNCVDYLLVGGGGGGGCDRDSGGGGGGGAVVEGRIVGCLDVGDYAVTVGGGGAAFVSTNLANGYGGVGGDSAFLSITAPGGGGGGRRGGALSGAAGGGCGCGNRNDTFYLGGAGAPRHGFDGGYAASWTSNTYCASGGGGGAGASGGGGSWKETTGRDAGKGGNGLPSSITGNKVYYGGGGGGGCMYRAGSPGAGGIGGGGAGGKSTGSENATGPGQDGVANSGGGGGGTGTQSSTSTPLQSGAGGSGVVILRYPATLYFVSGVVRDGSNTPCRRIVRLFRRSTGELVDASISDASTGGYVLYTPYPDEHDRVVLDDDGAPLLNDLVDRVIPA